MIGALGILFSHGDFLKAQTFTVTNGNSSGDGSLAAAITAANTFSTSSANQATINFAGVTTVNLPTSGSGQLFINSNVTINGGSGVTINGSHNDRIFFIAGGTVNLTNLTLQNGNATGGFAAEAGGGAGLGGALFVANGKGIAGSNVTLATNVTLNGVTFQNNSATGGSIADGRGSGGGGMGGNADASLGGGGFGKGANGGGGAGSFTGGASGGGKGGANGGGGTSNRPTDTGSGGGVGGATTSGSHGGDGGFGGGGGAGEPGTRGVSGNGGFGGGGGGGSAAGGNGGFGGGAALGEGSPGFGGGNNANGNSGGLGAGGAVFVMGGANLTVIGGNFGGDTITGGAGDHAAQNGHAYGNGLFLLNTITLDALPGHPTTIAEDIYGNDTNPADLGSTTSAGITIGDADHPNGTIILSGKSVYNGLTTVTHGNTLSLAAGGSTSSSIINLAESGTTLDITAGNQTIRGLMGASGSNVQLGANSLTVNGADVTTYAGSFHGTGQLIEAGPGTLILGGENEDLTGGITVNGGTLGIANNLAFGKVLITINNGGIRAEGRAYDVFNPLAVSGTFTVGRGTTFWGNVALNSNITIYSNNPDPMPPSTSGFNGAFTGSHSITYDASEDNPIGTIILRGNSTYSGGTMIIGGTVAVGGAILTGTPNAFGTGNVLLTGEGVLTTADSNHIINVNGNYMQGPLTSKDDPGVLQLTVKGNLAGVTYDYLNVKGTADLGGVLEVNVINYAPGRGQHFIFVKAAGGIVPHSGFADIVCNLPTLKITSDGIGINGESFDIVQLPFLAYAQTPNQRSIANYIDAYDPNFSQGQGAFPNVIDALNNVSPDPAALTSALDQLTPTKFGNFTTSTVVNNATFTTQQFDSYFEGLRSDQGTFLGSASQIDASGLTMMNPNVDPGLAPVSSRLLAWNPSPLQNGLLSDSASSLLGGTDMKTIASPTAPADLWNVFVQGNVVLGQSFSQSDTAYSSSTSGGMQVGFDYRFTPHFLAGAAFGYSHTNATLDTMGSNATLRSYAPTVFASYADGGWYGNALASYGFNQFNENRAMNFGGFSGTANGSPDGEQEVADADGGYDFHANHLTFGPNAGVQYTHFHVAGYNEGGAPGADLAVGSQNDTSFRSRLGGHISYVAHLFGADVMPHLNVSWQHEYLNQTTQITSSFLDVGAGSFTVGTPNGSPDSALIDAGFNINATQSVTVFVDYLAQAGQSNYFGQSVQAGVKIGF